LPRKIELKLGSVKTHNHAVMPNGKIIVITGVTRGLGRALMDEFVRSGHTVLGCGRSDNEIKRLRAKFGPPHDFYPVDVSVDEEVKSWASLLLTSQRRRHQQKRAALGNQRPRIFRGH
jgi:NAD(P)-dependent dehydrogenase (short-subunit alcohol dehydrogenase family)